MAEGWSRSEVAATVADYFDMLEQELRGLDYNKSEHRRRLAALLDGRSDGAIERKHQNISAILIELGFVYLPGYKPLHNYQQLLYETVSRRLASSTALVNLVREQVSEPVPVPTVDDILASLVEPPRPDPLRFQYARTARERPAVQRGVDYVALEAKNQLLGLAGEEFVVRFEAARLEAAGQGRLASRIEHVSRTRGDGLGYDVLSFDTNGRERLIEVKTTAYGASTPFFVTPNEVEVSRESAEQFHLYRPFAFRRTPRLFVRQGPLDQAFDLEPSQFRATVV